MFSARLLIILTGHQNNAEFMISRRVLWYRLYLVLNIAIVWVLFSLIFLYNIIEVDKEVLAQRRLSFFSLAFAIVGIIVAGAEAFFSQKHVPQVSDLAFYYTKNDGDIYLVHDCVSCRCVCLLDLSLRWRA